MARLAVASAIFLGVTALVAACSVYDESLLGAGGSEDTSSGKGSGKGSSDDGSGGAGATTTSDASSATTTTSTSTSSPSSTGETGAVTTGSQCDTPDDCPGEDSECSTVTCEGNQCGILNAEAGVVLARQTDGDCIVQTCDGQGGISSDVDDEDLPAQTDDCIIPTCSNGSIGQENAPERDPCSANGLCDGAGVCVDCLEDGDCTGGDDCSEAHTCVAPQCNDGSKNGNETDTDCGGGTCDPCQNGDDCEENTDCLSNACNGTCQPSCTDTILNNGESDTDCGGPNCDPCGLGLACDDEDDCGSGFCLDDACRPALFFSEYVEGSGQNKALEIFNFGNEDVDMSVTGANCSVGVYTNGSTTAGATIGLTGTITPFGVWVLVKSGGSPTPSPTLTALADQTSGSLTFNGDDAVSLQCAGVVLDVIGEIGDFPDSVGWGSGVTSTLNHTLRRKGSITEGDRNGADAFDPAVQWDGSPIDTFSGLGDHP